MNIKLPKMGGLKTAPLTPVPGVVSPSNGNNATPNMVGAQSVVKAPKAKKMGQATDKPSQFFKAEQNQLIKHKSIKALNDLLMKVRSKPKA
jgi:hypothetical protein